MSDQIQNELSVKCGEHGHVSPELVSRVLSAFGLPAPPQLDIEGLSSVYGAWCRNVPFDNIRKMTTLFGGGEGKLPGLDPEEFFENWLENGSGGTCWPSSNALWALLCSLGFDARRVAGAMFDLPDINHGTVKVKIDGRDWLVDTSMLTNRPLPLRDEIYVSADPSIGVEIERSGSDFIVWNDFAPLPEYIPCGLRIDPVDSNFYHERYEEFSRGFSPFNQRLYVRKGGDDGPTVLLGNTRFKRTVAGLEVEEFGRDELREYLVDQIGISRSLFDKWAASGSLDASLTPPDGPGPVVAGVRPSRRG